MGIRSNLIRLAVTREDMRPHLLPLLKTADAVDDLSRDYNLALDYCKRGDFNLVLDKVEEMGRYKGLPGITEILRDAESSSYAAINAKKNLVRSLDNVRKEIIFIRQSSRNATSKYYAVKELPPVLQQALKKVSYGRRDIEVKTNPTYTVSGAGGDGERSFAMAVNLETGQTNIEYGSWGGSNPWALNNQVDRDNTPRPIPINGAVIKGTEGGGPTWAYIILNPANMAALIEAPKESLNQQEKAALTAISYKPGYRADEFSRNRLGPYSLKNPLVQALLAKGLIQATGAGIRITTEGRNALRGV